VRTNKDLLLIKFGEKGRKKWNRKKKLNRELSLLSSKLEENK
jgi:hypothetical protein